MSVSWVEYYMEKEGFVGYEVVKILKKMKSEKCTGLDGIQIEFLKKG